MTDEMLMRSAQLTPEYRPLVDFHSQYSTVQNQKGWRYGCAQRPSLHRPDSYYLVLNNSHSQDLSGCGCPLCS